MTQGRNGLDGRTGHFIKNGLPVIFGIVSNVLQGMSLAHGAIIITFILIAIQISAELYTELARVPHDSEPVQVRATCAECAPTPAPGYELGQFPHEELGPVAPHEEPAP